MNSRPKPIFGTRLLWLVVAPALSCFAVYSLPFCYFALNMYPFWYGPQAPLGGDPRVWVTFLLFLFGVAPLLIADLIAFLIAIALTTRFISSEWFGWRKAYIKGLSMHFNLVNVLLGIATTLAFSIVLYIKWKK